MTPLPGHQVIPGDWSAHHQPTAVATMNATCDLHDGQVTPEPYPPGSDPTWSPTGAVLATAVPCRVQALNDSRTNAQADQIQGVRQYLVTTPINVVPDLTVTDRGPVLTVHGGDDPHMEGMRLRVVDVQHGSYAWERDLVCTHNQTQD